MRPAIQRASACWSGAEKDAGGPAPGAWLAGRRSARALQQALGHVQHALAGAVALAQTADAQGGPEGRAGCPRSGRWRHGSRRWPGQGRRCRKKPLPSSGNRARIRRSCTGEKVLHLVHQHMPPGQGRARREGAGTGAGAAVAATMPSRDIWRGTAWPLCGAS